MIRRIRRRFPGVPGALTLTSTVLVLLAACGREDPGSSVPQASPPSAATAGSAAASGGTAPAGPIFEDEAKAAGIDFVQWNGMTGELYMAENMGSGAALFDYDGDGDLDLFLVQENLLGPGRTVEQAVFPPPGPLPLSDRLYRNDSERDAAGRVTRLRFTDVTAASGVGALTAGRYGMGVAAGDYDNDGRVDLYLTNLGPNQMLHNEGGTFTDATAATGTGDDRWGVPAVFFDYDGDGWLDLFVGNYLEFDPADPHPCRSKTGARDYCDPSVFAPQPDRLFHNRGDGSFEDATARAGLGEARSKALGAVAADFDGDGRVDLYVASDGTPNLLWRNLGNGTFEDDAFLAGCAVNAEGEAEASMGVAAGDYDDDGDPDLVMAHLTGQTHTLFVNGGDGLFEDETAVAGLGPATWEATGFGADFVDYDNDGRLDLLVVDGAVQALEALVREKDPYPLHQPNQLFHNEVGADGAVRFVDVSHEAGAPFRLSRVSRGAAFGDVDDDGDLDVVVVNNSGPAELLVNRVGQDRPWLGLRLVGSVGGRPVRDMLGARVGLFRRGRPPVWREAESDGSYASASDPRVVFGLGDDPEVERLRVVWPDGTSEDWTGVPVGRYTVLRQGEGRRVEP